MPHPNGRAAMRMLETEGFTNPGYVDIFDGGPTMVGQIDALRTIAHSSDAVLGAVLEQGGDKMLLTTGRQADFRGTYAFAIERDAGGVSRSEEGRAGTRSITPWTSSCVPKQS